MEGQIRKSDACSADTHAKHFNLTFAKLLAFNLLRNRQIVETYIRQTGREFWFDIRALMKDHR